MNRIDSKMGWEKLLSLSAVAMVAALVALFGLVDTAQAQSGETGDRCVHYYQPGAVCTANDVRIKELTVVTLIESCAEGEYGWMEAIFRAHIAAPGSPDRYDIGLFIALDGLDAKVSPGNCYHDYLEPPITPTPIYGDFNSDGIPDVYNLDPAFLGYWNGETGDPNDTCGDIQTGTEIFKEILIPLRLPCVDLWPVDRQGNPLPDGIMDVGVCASWDNNQQNACAGIQGAFPGTNSKCGCERLNLTGVPMAVDLASFAAAPQGNGVLLSWETATEFDNLGFHLYRAGTLDGQRTRLNQRLIPSQSPGSAVGAAYTFLDETAAPGNIYYYWLEDVDVYGVAVQHGPAVAEVPLARALPGRPRPVPRPNAR